MATASIVPFESSNLPSYISKVDQTTLNDDLTAHAGAGFPVISIKGKVFATVRDGERKILTNPKDPDSPATSIDIVIVKANKATSKVYYEAGYDEKAESKKPDCFSNDGIRPDPSSESKQSELCATCKHNVWGSKVGDQGSGKGKSCQDSVRLAISTPGAINDPHLLRVPPASIRALGEYGKMLKQRGVKYNMMVTKIAFEMEAPTPKLTFKPVGFLPEDMYNKVTETAGSELVRNILGDMGAFVSEEPAAKPEQKKVDKKAEEPDPKKKDKPASKTEEKAPDPETIEISLDNLSFDD